MLKNILLVAALLAAGHANAALTVNTGAPDGSGFPLSLDGSNWFAGQIELSQAQTINSVSTWLNDQGNIASSFAGDSFTIALYQDSAQLPGNLLKTATGHFTTSSGQSGWNGASNLNWSLGAGSYWLAFEIGGADTFAGVAPVNAPNPLAHYAFNDGGYAGYHTVAGYALGIQVDATVAAVPEPESYALLLAGLGLIGAITRRNKQTPV